MLESLRDRVWVNEYVLKGQLGRGTVQNKIREKVNRECDYGRIFVTFFKLFFSDCGKFIKNPGSIIAYLRTKVQRYKIRIIS